MGISIVLFLFSTQNNYFPFIRYHETQINPDLALRHKSRVPSIQRRTDRQTDQPTDRPTEWLIELRARDKKSKYHSQSNGNQTIICFGIS